jgi:hypothetical protein
MPGADNGPAENGPEPAKLPSVLIIVALKIFPKISSNQSGQHEHDVWLISTPWHNNLAWAYKSSTFGRRQY